MSVREVSHPVSTIVHSVFHTIAVFVGTLMICGVAAAEKPAVEVFEIYYGKATELVEPVKTVLSSEGKVSASATGNMLVVRDYPANIQDVRNLLAKLDKTPKSVSVTVEFVEESQLRRTGINISWRAAGAGWSIASVPPPPKGDVSAGIGGVFSSVHGKKKQFLRLLENTPGKIFVGESVPMTRHYHEYGLRHGFITRETVFKDAGTSFAVTVKTLPDKKIMISLEPEVSYYDRERKTFPVKNAATSVILDDPGSVIIGSSGASESGGGAEFLRGLENRESESNFVMILTARSEGS